MGEKKNRIFVESEQTWAISLFDKEICSLYWKLLLLKLSPRENDAVATTCFNTICNKTKKT